MKTRNFLLYSYSLVFYTNSRKSYFFHLSLFSNTFSILVQLFVVGNIFISNIFFSIYLSILLSQWNTKICTQKGYWRASVNSKNIMSYLFRMKVLEFYIMSTNLWTRMLNRIESNLWINGKYFNTKSRKHKNCFLSDDVFLEMKRNIFCIFLIAFYVNE